MANSVRITATAPLTTRPSSLAARLFPTLDIGLAVLAAAIWYVRPQEGAWPLALIGVAWLLRLVVTGQLTRSTPFDFPLILFLVSAFAAAGIAYNQQAGVLDSTLPYASSWAKYWTIVAAIALFYAVANLRRVDQLWWFVRAYVWLAVIVTIYYIATQDWSAKSVKFDVLAQIGALLSQPLPTIEGRRLYPNVVGGIIAFVVPFFAPLIVGARRKPAVLLLWGIAFVVSLVGLLLSTSRGAWLTLVVVCLAWALARAFASFKTQRVRVIVIAFALLIVAVVAASTLDLGSASIAPLAASNATGSVVFSRLSVWRGGWSLAQDYFWTGAGLGSFPLLFSAYYALLPVLFVTHAHNIVLDLLVEQGVFGLVAYVWLLIAFVWWGVRGVRASSAAGGRDAQRVRWLLEAALASAAIVFLQGLLDDLGAYASRALLLLFVPMGIVAALQVYVPRTTVRVPKRLLLAGAALAVLIVIWQRAAIISSLYANLGALSQARVELSTYRAPERVPELVRRDANLDAALNNFTRALNADAANRTAAQRLAMIALAHGQYDDARTVLEPVYARDTSDEITLQLLGDAYLALGRGDEAFALWSRVSDAESKLHLEADLRYRDDKQRAVWTIALADRIHAARP